ncbi:MAG TPA: hypothetical protein VFK97_01865 [Candidatus Saccharimonadales bacterium]|nr:hypothetical protein [Candidatus Saccharimonadales bacterium]
MAKKLPTEAQELLFSGDIDNGGEMLTWEDREANLQLNALRFSIENGIPMVDVLDRARRITLALDEMTEISQIDYGFLTSTHTKTRVRIDDTYGENITPIVEENAKKKLPLREKRVKDLLGPATGYAALRAVVGRPGFSEMPTLDEINARAKHTWKRFFYSKFPGPDNLERRNRYRAIMAKHIEIQQNLRRHLGTIDSANSGEKVA